MKLNKEDIKRVKAMGCLHNRESEDAFSVRVITRNGTLTAREMAQVAKAAETYGSGKIAMTSRMTLEIVGVSYEAIPVLQDCLAQAGLVTGGTGDKIRPIVACKGTTCVFGQLDTQAVAETLHQRFFEGWSEISLPHKFKIAVGGCPNNCAKPDLNDFGMIGQNAPEIHSELCRGCKSCIVTAGCQMGAPRLENGKIAIDPALCNACGKCIQSCHFHCLTSRAKGVKVVLGGKWGRKRRPANELDGIFTVEQAMTLLEKSLEIYRNYGTPKERFGDMIDRVGFDQIVKELL